NIKCREDVARFLNVTGKYHFVLEPFLSHQLLQPDKVLFVTRRDGSHDDIAGLRVFLSKQRCRFDQHFLAFPHQLDSANNSHEKLRIAEVRTKFPGPLSIDKQSIVTQTVVYGHALSSECRI